MKKIKNDKLNTLLYIIVCFILVIATAKLLAFARNSFEDSQKVIAETLPPLPQEIEQNQIRYLTEEGYLTAPPILVETTK